MRPTTTMFYLSKGGVGKTTMSVLYAWYQRQLGRRVLFVDTDLQCNSSKVLARVDVNQYPAFATRTVGTILDFSDGSFAARFASLETSAFDLISAVEDFIFDQRQGEAIAATVRLLSESRCYDTIIFDTASGLSEELVALLLTVDNLVIPVSPDNFSFDQVSVILQFKDFADQRRVTPLNIAGVLINGMIARSTAQSAEALLRRGYGEYTISTAIGLSEPIRQAIDRATPIFAMATSVARMKHKELVAAFEEIDRRSV